MLGAALSRRWWIAGLLVLALAAASNGLALGKTPGYNIKLSVPTEVRQGQMVDITVSGDAPRQGNTTMDVYTSRLACLPKWKDEVELAKGDNPAVMLRLGGDKVSGAFSRRLMPLHAGAIGTHHACAYLFTSLGGDKTFDYAAAYWLVKSRA